MDLSQFGGISVIPLAIASIASLSITLERGYFWYKTKRRQSSLKRKLLEQCFNNEQSCFQLRPKEQDNIMTKFFQKTTIPSPNDLEELRDSCDLNLEILEPELSRYENTLGTIISIAPLIGLLGTVLGLMRSMSGLTLQAISESNTNVMAGISEALISTAAGLTIAITTLIANNLFKSFRLSQLHTLQSVALEIESKFKAKETQQH
ncbi:MAG: MotA/TolQ/ExbB proton channel family protein [Synechococcus sp. SP1 MAG]|nr:MotA/TolQ/ExbB proton channel family protein [Synechococcus sp. SP1 MAG]